MVTLTDSAKSIIEKYITIEKPVVRLSIKGGGCSGFSYEFNEQKTSDVEADDLVIDISEGKKFVIDPISLIYLDGSIIDYTESLAASGFQIKNPNETTSCGCGNSFSV